MFGLFKKGPPTEREVIFRAYALHAAIMRTFVTPPPDVIADCKRKWSAAEWTKFCSEMNAKSSQELSGLRRRPYAKALSPAELQFLGRSIADVPVQEYANMQWRIEALQTLLWSLQRIPKLPPMNEATKVSEEILKPPIMERFETGLSQWKLRARAEIEKAREVAELWNWRSRTRQLIESGSKLDPELIKQTGLKSFDEIVRHTARFAADAGDIVMVDEDFAVQGKAYRDLNGEAWALTTSISIERHFALNWLCGYAPKNRWDETPTDT